MEYIKARLIILLLILVSSTACTTSTVGESQHPLLHGDPATPPPVLPIPHPGPNRYQASPAGSGTYLVWNQWSTEPVNQAFISFSSDILALNLATGIPLTVTDVPCDQSFPAVSGSLVVWQTVPVPCTGGTSDIVGRNLETGVSYDIATGSANQVYPAVADQTVVWIETNDTATKILTKNLDNNQVQEVKHLNVDVGVAHPQISGAYILWAEMGQNDQSTKSRPVEIYAHNRHTDITQLITQYSLRAALQPEYALHGSRIVWYNEGVHGIDLSNGETFRIDTPEVESLDLYDNYIVWATTPQFQKFDIYGSTWQEHRVIPLIAGQGNHLQPRIVNDWLVWSDEGGSASGHLKSSLLMGLFTTLPTK